MGVLGFFKKILVSLWKFDYAFFFFFTESDIMYEEEKAHNKSYTP